MRAQLRMLVRLQRIDLEMKRAEEEREENPRRVAELEEELAAAQAKVEEEKARIEALRKERRGLEREVEEGETKLKRSQSRLLEVKTNQEYKAMLKEIEQIGQATRAGEDRVLELMEAIGAAETELAALNERFAGRHKEIEAGLAELKAATARFDKEVTRLERCRAEVVAAISPELVSRYDFIRSRRNGRAVVPVKDAVCQACHMDIPPQSFNELMRFEELMTCPSCSRIIFWGDAADFDELLKEAV